MAATDVDAVFWDFGGVILSSPFEAFNRYEAANGLPLDFIRGVNATNPDTNAWALLERSDVSPEQFDTLFADESGGTGKLDLQGPQTLTVLADFGAAMTTASQEELQKVLETRSVRHRIEETLVLLKKELDISRLKVELGKRIEERLSKQQREFFLREQLKAIRQELGEGDDKTVEVEELRQKLVAAEMPEQVATAPLRAPALGQRSGARDASRLRGHPGGPPRQRLGAAVRGAGQPRAHVVRVLRHGPLAG